MRTQAPEVKQIAAAAFPSYSGRSLQVRQFTGKMRLDSYWSGGSRDYYVFIDLATMKQYTVPENGTPFSNGGQILECSELPMNVALVEYHQGRCDGITIFVREENMSKLLPPPGPELTEDEMIVLCATSCFKSSYAGEKNYRFTQAREETLIGLTSWDTAKASCIAKGLLNKAGAITDAGRNAVEGKRLEHYRPKFFYALHLENRTMCLIYGHDNWYALRQAKDTLTMPDGERPTGVGRARSLAAFVRAANRDNCRILFHENDPNRAEIELLAGATPEPSPQFEMSIP